MADLNTNQNTVQTAISNYMNLRGTKQILTASGTISSNTSIVAAVTGKRIKVLSYFISTAYSAGTLGPIFTDGNGGTTLRAFLLQAIANTISAANLAMDYPSFMFGTSAGNALYLNPAGQSVFYDISYFVEDAV